MLLHKRILEKTWSCMRPGSQEEGVARGGNEPSQPQTLAGSGGDKTVCRNDRTQRIDMVIFSTVPLFNNLLRESNIEMISKACRYIYNIPIATNIATAESLVIGLQKGDLEWRENI